MQAEIQVAGADVLGDLRRCWKQLVSTDLAFRIAAFVLLVPLSGLALQAFLWSQGTSVIADKDILVLLLSPFGLLGLVAVGAVRLAIVAYEAAGLLVIGYGSRRGVRVGCLGALRFVAGVALPVLRLAGRLLGTTLLLATPFLAAVAAVGYALLTEHDINFYLAATPPAFWLALGLATAILAVGLWVLLPRLVGWTLALPLVLFEGTEPRTALQRSAARMHGRRALLAVMVLLWAASATLASAAIFAMLRLVGLWLVVPLAGRGSALLVLGVGSLVIVWVLTTEIVGLASAAVIALLVVRTYDVAGGGGAESDGAVDLGAEAAGWRFSTAGILAGLTLAAAAAGFVGMTWLDAVGADPDVQIIAHRGAAARAPENTLAAVERAITDGADWIEIDVLETADGEVVVVHDRDLMRVGGVNLAIADTTLEGLRAVDVGSSFSPEFAGERVPTLAELLERTKGRARVIIELKYFGRNERLEERVVEIVEAAGVEAEIVVMSLNHAAMRTMRRLRPDWRVGLIVAVAIGNVMTLDADFLAVNASLATPLFVRNAHAAGKDVYAWPVYESVEKVRMIGHGVDGLITNDPAAGRRVLAVLGEMSPSERLLLDVALWMGFIPDATAEPSGEAAASRP